MLILNPREVRFGIQRWKDARIITIDRLAVREVVEWGDLGPHPTFADVPRSRVRVRVVMDAGPDMEDAPHPGETDTLAFTASPSGGESGRRVVETTCVVISVAHDINTAKGATRTIEFVAISTDGAADPITITQPGV